jgi:4-hydroxy-2-oxoheptanedioate aldolase
MIETAQGIANAAAICATPGIAGIVIGPADLSIGLGLEPFKAFTTDQIFGPLDVIRAECEKNGIILGIFSAGDAGRWVERGCRFIIIGGDASLLARALVSNLEAARGLAKEHLEQNATPYQ